MGCCGRKRSEWLRKVKETSPNEKKETSKIEALKEYEPKVFEYTGSRSLKIRGANTSNVYYFRFPGHRLEVAYEDSFALMAEADLIIHTL